MTMKLKNKTEAEVGMNPDINQILSGSGPSQFDSPQQRLAEAVLERSYRDLFHFAGATRKKYVKIFESARGLLKGESREYRDVRDMLCTCIGMDVEYAERMADEVIEVALSRSDLDREQGSAQAVRHVA